MYLTISPGWAIKDRPEWDLASTWPYRLLIAAALFIPTLLFGAIAWEDRARVLRDTEQGGITDGRHLSPARSERLRDPRADRGPHQRASARHDLGRDCRGRSAPPSPQEDPGGLPTGSGDLARGPLGRGPQLQRLLSHPSGRCLRSRLLHCPPDG